MKSRTSASGFQATEPQWEHRAGKIVRVAILAVLALMIVPMTTAQTYTVLHSFIGGPDGQGPYGRLTMDRAGNLYGVNMGGLDNCRNGGGFRCGMSFRMTKNG